MAKKATKKGHAATCPACGYELRFKKLPKRGNYITCPGCHSFLEVVRVAPLSLEWGFEEPIEEGYYYGPSSQFDDDHRVGEEIGTDYDDLEVEWIDRRENYWEDDSIRG